jgi:proteasome lid subunit RPN8/RPN11
MPKIHQSAYDQLRQHSEAAYPHECCGILLGSKDGIITQAIPVPNVSPTPKNHYQIHPKDLIYTQKSAHQNGGEILGFYHSHPDSRAVHPAAPSSTDLAEAHWLGCSYVITSVQNGRAIETRSFVLSGSHEEDKRFEPETIAIIPSQITSALS